MSKENWNIIALGGSIVVGNKIHTNYLKRFHDFLELQIEEGKKFVIVVGGGAIARDYQNSASRIKDLRAYDKDWLGVHATRLNAQLLRTIFVDSASPKILKDPEKTISKNDINKYSLFIAAGWKPGWSTDYVAFRLAHMFGAGKVLIATRISHVYDKDISKYKDARAFENILWRDYIKLIGTKWTPGMKAPVDPVAAQFAQKNNIKGIVLRGTNLKNLKKYLDGEKFVGTTLS